METKLLPWALEGVCLGDSLLELGSGPGIATDLLGRRFPIVTGLELDSAMAESLGRRMVNSNVTVVQGDATALPFADESFTGAVCFTMLHHVPSEELQNRLLAESCRVLKRGGTFAGSDSLFSRGMQLIHMGDTMHAVDPQGFGARLESAGFHKVKIETRKRVFRFSAHRR